MSKSLRGFQAESLGRVNGAGTGCDGWGLLWVIRYILEYCTAALHAMQVRVTEVS